jgi:hypothetical protein
MPRLPKFLVILATSVGIAGGSHAFSLLGPAADWQTERLGYHLLSPFEVAADFGPMPLGEEYRYNVPTIYYGFTPEFLNYFGQRGAQEVDKAFQVLNQLPAASRMNIDDFPMTSLRVNHRAAELSLRDLKSEVLGLVLHELGLGNPVNYVFTLRSRWEVSDPDLTNFFVINRNYDPATWRPTPFINGQLWTYTFVGDLNESVSIVNTAPVDPLALAGFVNRPVAGTDIQPIGSFWTSLTRDDVGALRYIYRSENYNVESLRENVTGTAGGGPWGPPPGATNIAGTNFINIALRPGREKLQFLRANYDSTFGIFEPFTNQYTDTYVTNAQAFTQNLERPLTVPDILFHVADVIGGDGSDAVPAGVIAHLDWVNNDELNGIPGNLGPGVIGPGVDGVPSITYTLNSQPHVLWNIYPITPMDELGAIQAGFFWGSFDGSTNLPVVYPVGIEVHELERLVLRGETGSGWHPPPFPTDPGDGGAGGGFEPIGPGL